MGKNAQRRRQDTPQPTTKQIEVPRAAFTITIMADPAALAQDAVSISTTTLPDAQAQLGDVVKATRLAADFFMRKLGALEQAQAMNQAPAMPPPASSNGNGAEGERVGMDGRGVG